MTVLSLACGTSPAPGPPTPTDPFAVVRATSEAAYQAGQSALVRGNYLQACVDLDTAKTNDPDNRPEIQQALEQALAQCLTPPPPQATSPPAAAAQRTLVVATLAAGVSTTLIPTPVPPSAAATPNVAAAASPNATPPVPASPAAASTTAAAQPPGGGQTPGAGTAALVDWSDPQGRFSVGAPSDWVRTEQPQTLVGAGVVGFHDASGVADIDVAVDSNTRAVSPELYAASLELAMQQQVPGYASEQVTPGTTAGVPSVRRVFTFAQRDAAGQPHQARGFQLAIVKGSTPYLISGTAPAELFQQYTATFDQIVGSFRFS